MDSESNNKKILYLNTNPDIDLDNIIKELEERKIENIRIGNYDEAEELKIKIEDLSKRLKQKKKKDLEMQHYNELENLEISYKRELENFNNYWDQQFKDLEEKSERLEKELIEKHKKEMDDLLNSLEQKLPKNIKYSKEYYELKSQEENLVKFQRFKEAGVVKKKLENIEKTDNIKFTKEKTEKVKAYSMKILKQQLNEKNALKMKIEAEYELLKKQRKTVFESLINKFKNRKFELDLQQKQEKLLSENQNLLKAKTTTGKLKQKKHYSLSLTNTEGNIRENTLMNDKKALRDINYHEFSNKISLTEA